MSIKILYKWHKCVENCNYVIQKKHTKKKANIKINRKISTLESAGT